MFIHNELSSLKEATQTYACETSAGGDDLLLPLTLLIAERAEQCYWRLLDGIQAPYQASIAS